jgi:hypothetical protein
MRVPIALAVTWTAITCVVWAAAGKATAASVEIKGALAQVTVVPEDRADIEVVFMSRHPRLPLKVRVGRRTVIDGGLKPSRIRACRTVGGKVLVRVAGLGEVPLEAFPRIVLRTPKDVDLTAGGAVFGSIGRATRVDLGAAGCGDWSIANVERELKVSLAGSGDARAGVSGSARLRVAGSGDISVGEVRGGVEVDVAGSGDVTVRRVEGPLNVHVAGSGDVTIAEGKAVAMTVSIAGPGNVDFGGVADRLDARIAGSGDVTVRKVRGPVKKAVMGPGAVRVN